VEVSGLEPPASAVVKAKGYVPSTCANDRNRRSLSGPWSDSIRRVPMLFRMPSAACLLPALLA